MLQDLPENTCRLVPQQYLSDQEFEEKTPQSSEVHAIQRNTEILLRTTEQADI